MTAIPSGFLAASLRPDPVVAPVRENIRWMALGRRFVDKLDPATFSRYLAAFFVGVAATVTWQSYLGWSGPVASASAGEQQVNAILLDTVRRSIDKLATSQEQMAREIDKIQSAQFVLYRHPADAHPAAPASTSSSTSGSASASTPPAEADARSDWRRQPCCQWPSTGGVW